MKKPGLLLRGASRAHTLAELMQHLVRRRVFFMIPLVVVLLLAGVLLLLSEGLSYVAPFVYTIF